MCLHHPCNWPTCEPSSIYPCLLFHTCPVQHQPAEGASHPLMSRNALQHHSGQQCVPLHGLLLFRVFQFVLKLHFTLITTAQTLWTLQM